MKVLFVTRNSAKFNYAKPLFDSEHLQLVQKKTLFDESRDIRVKKVSEEKLNQAIKRFGRPVIVEDTGFFIPSLHGFPATFSNFVLDTIGPKGILDLAKKDRACFFESVVGACDTRGNKKYFVQRDFGHISNYLGQPKNGKAWSGLWQIFIPKNYAVPLSEFTKKDFKKINLEWQTGSNFKKAARFLTK